MLSKKWLPLILVVAMTAAFAGCGGKDKALDVAGLELGRDASGLVKELTEKLGSIQDMESAQAALPDLKNIEGKLTEIAAKAKDLSPESKNALAGMVKGAMPALESQVKKLGEMSGVGETIMPTINSLLDKVRALA